MKRLLSLILTGTILLFTAALPAGAIPDRKVSYMQKDVTAYLFGMEEKTTLSCLFRDDLPTVPYVRAMDFLDQLYTVKFTCQKNSDGTFTVSDKNGGMVVDVERDTIHFDEFEEFVESDTKPYLETETADYLSDDFEYVVVDGYNAIDLDLAAYGIDLTAYGDQLYFPLTVIGNIFAITYHTAVYLDGAIYFFDVMADEYYFDTSPQFDSLTRDSSLIDFTYHELCFVMDHFYGYPPASKLAEPIREKGFDKAIEEYNDTTARAKELLLSDDLLDYFYGLVFLDEYLNDGGHTSLSLGLQIGMDLYPSSSFSKAFLESASDFSDDRLMTIVGYFQDLLSEQSGMTKLKGYRAEQFAAITQVKEWDAAAFYQSGDTGIFSFDEFEDAVVEPFKWSLDYAAEHGIGNFVIDLSVNGGGSTAVVVYMLSLMRDCSRMDAVNTLTGTHVYSIDTVDRNLDGAFDEKDDDVHYDMNFAILSSRFTFSAANALACLAHDNGIAVLGEASGGGTCALAMHYDPVGYAYALSDISIMTYPDGGNLDEGVTPDVALPARGKNYIGYYDVDSISAGIESFYSGAAIPTLTDETQAPDEPATEAEPAAQDNASFVIWYILLGAVILSAAAAVVLTILLLRRSKQNHIE